MIKLPHTCQHSCVAASQGAVSKEPPITCYLLHGFLLLILGQTALAIRPVFSWLNKIRTKRYLQINEGPQSPVGSGAELEVTRLDADSHGSKSPLPRQFSKISGSIYLLHTYASDCTLLVQYCPSGSCLHLLLLSYIKSLLTTSQVYLLLQHHLLACMVHSSPSDLFSILDLWKIFQKF